LEIERSAIRVLTELSEYSLEEFNDRLRLQKLVFLARKMGHDFGYTFNWYARGPYSPSLTRMLFKANEQRQFSRDAAPLRTSESEVVHTLRDFLQEDVESPRVLELLASVWYYIRRKTYSQEERDELVDAILQKKSKFERAEVEEAFDRIQRFIDS